MSVVDSYMSHVQALPPHARKAAEQRMDAFLARECESAAPAAAAAVPVPGDGNVLLISATGVIVPCPCLANLSNQFSLVRAKSAVLILLQWRGCVSDTSLLKNRSALPVSAVSRSV
jgi:hypothetical protein